MSYGQTVGDNLQRATDQMTSQLVGSAAAIQQDRVVILDQSRCQPNSPAFDYLRKQAGLGCPEARKPPCLQMREMRCVVLEDACPACLNRAKRCPNDAVRVVNLPHSLAPALTHR